MLTDYIPATEERVPLHTAPEINERIRIDTMAKIAYYKEHKKEIDKRLEELDREWDTERLLEANASSLVVLSVLLGFTRDWKWFILPGIIGGFLFQHAIQGWCPPIPIIRRLGFRTAKEINQERIALQCLKDRKNAVCDMSKIMEQ